MLGECHALLADDPRAQRPPRRRLQLSAATCPQWAHVCDVYAGLTVMVEFAL